MIIKSPPKELDHKPLITEKDSLRGACEVYMGRAIIEFWCDTSRSCDDPAFAWSVDDPAQIDEQWLILLLNALHGATRHIEDVYRHRLAHPPVP